MWPTGLVETHCTTMLAGKIHMLRYLSRQVLLGSFHSTVEGLFEASRCASASSAVSSPSQRRQGWCNPLLTRQISLQCIHNVSMHSFSLDLFGR